MLLYWVIVPYVAGDLTYDYSESEKSSPAFRPRTRRAATTQGKLNLSQTVQEVLALVGGEVKRNSASIQTQLAGDLSLVSGDRVQLQQLVLNLVMNGIEAMSSVGERARDLLITSRNLDPDQCRSR